MKFYSYTTRRFYDTDVDGTRTMMVPDPEWHRPTIADPAWVRPLRVVPGWVRPMIETPARTPGLPDSEGVQLEPDMSIEPPTEPDPDAEQPRIPDPDAVHPEIEVPNPECTVPIDALELSDAGEFNALFAEHLKGAQIVAGEDGRPVAVHRSDAERDAEASAVAREKRDALLRASDWTQLEDSPIVQPNLKEQWRMYRAALRALPTLSNWPNVTWPEPPKG